MIRSARATSAPAGPAAALVQSMTTGPPAISMSASAVQECDLWYRRSTRRSSRA